MSKKCLSGRQLASFHEVSRSFSRMILSIAANQEIVFRWLEYTKALVEDKGSVDLRACSSFRSS